MRTKVMLASAAVVMARLVLASIVVAQIVDESEPGVVPRPRFEAGLTAGAIVVLPEFGVIASVPMGAGSAFEIMTSRLPAFFDAPPHTLVQAQVRAVVREEPRSRKSLLVGVTRIASLRSDRGFFGSDGPKFVRPHVGLSLQWPITATIDSRFDVQGIVTFEREFPFIPRAVASWVWHSRARP